MNRREPAVVAGSRPQTNLEKKGRTMRPKPSRFLLLLFSVVFAACTTTMPNGPSGRGESGGERGEEAPKAGTYVLVVDNLPNLIFIGATRAAAKLTMVPPAVPAYTTITAVTSLPPLPNPPVNSTAPRTGVENNYASFTAYLYAYNLPADNDFHLIIGDTPAFISGTTHVINVEVSGRPNGADVVFQAVRTAFLNAVGNPINLPRSTYQCIPVPFAIQVAGGPFWDTSHPHGGSGTSTCHGADIKTSNGWELHPATSIN